MKFQTLPGIIPRFYEGYEVLLTNPKKMFQTLPGIIPRFYAGWLPDKYREVLCFKPFQGLFRVSTRRVKL
ncbi:hypothetical protein U27_01546 [Candidatus Vecturithrix granuli]|uniref:Uncharacterized protein n=1 Tax=Vecturithrix granuli TaxID=1499967 RepID=A0A081CAP0_VECG1|nr:hypothetical protein U27_01546 [Candidatus Vecturithrix granuli]